MNSLLFCPFCGGEAQDDFIEDVSYIIECYVCEATTGCQDSAAEAIAAWNRRAAPASLTPAPQGTASEVMRVFAIQVEKRLCEALGRSWSPSGMSIESLIADLKDTSLTQAATSEPTDLSKRLRAKAVQPFGPGDHGLLVQAADEIERYYGGMLNWKRTAEAKDAAPAAAHPAPSVKTWQERMTEAGGSGWTPHSFMADEIADLRAALSAQQAGVQELEGEYADWSRAQLIAHIDTLREGLSAGVQDAPRDDLDTALTVFDMGLGFALCHRDFTDTRNAVKKLQKDFDAIRVMIRAALYASSAVTSDERDLMEAACAKRYSDGDHKHTSILMRLSTERDAYRAGWKDRAALASQGVKGGEHG